MENKKTHWLQNPNKNYLGHWDLPEKNDLILTIKSAKWEEVKNPIKNTIEEKRVIRFNENYKPLICNQTNAEAIVMSTGVKFMEDSVGQKIQLYIGVHKDNRTKSDIDCIRVREIKLEKPSLTKEMPAFEKAKDYINNNGNIDDIKKKYNLSPEIEKELKA